MVLYVIKYKIMYSIPLILFFFIVFSKFSKGVDDQADNRDTWPANPIFNWSSSV